MQLSYELIKSLHLIFIITWFAGLFYIVRLFIYQAEAIEENNSDKMNYLIPQFRLMSWRLWYIITWPSAIITLILGPLMLSFYWPIEKLPWIHLKLTFVALLYIYQFITHRIFFRFQKTLDLGRWKTKRLRFWNEAPTLLLFIIIFTVVYKDLSSWAYGLIGLLLLGVSMMIAIKLYKRKNSGQLK